MSWVWILFRKILNHGTEKQSEPGVFVITLLLFSPLPPPFALTPLPYSYSTFSSPLACPSLWQESLQPLLQLWHTQGGLFCSVVLPAYPLVKARQFPLVHERWNSSRCSGSDADTPPSSHLICDSYLSWKNITVTLSGRWPRGRIKVASSWLLSLSTYRPPASPPNSSLCPSFKPPTPHPVSHIFHPCSWSNSMTQQSSKTRGH